MATADLLLELMFSWIAQREDCAKQLKKQAQELESLRENCNGSECVGSSVSVVGAACLIGAGVATFVSGGAAAPFLGLLGAAYTGTGVAISVGTKIFEHFSSSSTIKKAQEIENKSNEIAAKIQQRFKQLRAEIREVSPHADPDELDQHMMTAFVGAMARRHEETQHINIQTINYRQFLFESDLERLHFHQTSSFISQPEVMVGVVGILAFFALKNSGKKSNVLFIEGTKQLLKEMSATAANGGKKLLQEMSSVGFKTAIKGGAMVVGGVVGMAFALPEAIDNWKDQIQKNHVTEASQSLKDTADTILNMCQTLRRQFRKIKETLEKLADVQRCIANSNRSSVEKQKLIQFALEMSKDEAVVQWLTANPSSDPQFSEMPETSQSLELRLLVFFELITLFYELVQVLSQEREDIDIIFVAHGAISGSMMSAGWLCPLFTIKDTLIYSPWNCYIDADVAYGVATGRLRPQHRRFLCTGEGCHIPHNLHWPTNLPNCWNSMRAARGQRIPKIYVSTLEKPVDHAWERFLFLEREFGPPGRNRVVIPFMLPFGISATVPFTVITFIISLVLLFSKYKATVHLAACLGKQSPETTLDVDHLKRQYSCTIDETFMASADEMLSRDTELYRALKAVFGVWTSSTCAV